jgi:hypothetical protein
MKKPTRAAGAMGPGREEKSRAMIRANAKGLGAAADEVNKRVRGQKVLGRKDAKTLSDSYGMIDKAVKLREESSRIKEAGKRMGRAQAMQKANRAKMKP